MLLWRLLQLLLEGQQQPLLWQRLRLAQQRLMLQASMQWRHLLQTLLNQQQQQQLMVMAEQQA
jgi:hypothetical protein